MGCAVCSARVYGETMMRVSGRLRDAERRQFRVFDARIDPSLVETQIKIALSMSQQEHGS